MLSCSDDPEARADLEDFAVSACEQARKHGWTASARWSDNGLKLSVQNATDREVREFVRSLNETAARRDATIVSLDEQPAHEVHDREDAPIPWGTVVHARLTRELLCSLPEGAYVASDSHCSECAASLGRVGPFSVRAQQWQRAQLAGLDGCVCRVLWSHDDFMAFCARTTGATGSVWV